MQTEPTIEPTSEAPPPISDLDSETETEETATPEEIEAANQTAESEAADYFDENPPPDIDNPPRERPEDRKAEEEEEKQAEAEAQEREDWRAHAADEIYYAEEYKVTLTVKVDDGSGNEKADCVLLKARKTDAERVAITVRRAVESIKLDRFARKQCGPQVDFEQQQELAFNSSKKRDEGSESYVETLGKVGKAIEEKQAETEEGDTDESAETRDGLNVDSVVVDEIHEDGAAIEPDSENNEAETEVEPTESEPDEPTEETERTELEGE